MKPKCILWGLTGISCLLVACDVVPVEKQTLFYSEICVEGVVYLRAPNGSLTPKVNADFYPYTCGMLGANNG